MSMQGKKTKRRRVFSPVADLYGQQSEEESEGNRAKSRSDLKISSSSSTTVYRATEGLSSTIIPPSLMNSFDDRPIVLGPHSDDVNAVAFSPSDHLLASGSNSTIQLWNVETRTTIATLKGHSDQIRSLAFSPDAALLASASLDKSIRFWDVGSWTQTAKLEGHLGKVWCISFSPDGAHLASGSEDTTIRLWDVKSRNSMYILEGHTSDVRSVAFSPDGKSIASGSWDHTVRLWDVASRSTTAIMHGHSHAVISAPFSPSGVHVASVSIDQTLRLWDAATGAHIATMQDHTNLVHSAAFSPDGKYIASGAYDGTIRLYDVESTAHVSTINCLGWVLAITFSNDGTRLASGSNDRAVRIWKVFSEETRSPQRTILTSDSAGLTYNTIDGQQDPIILASTSMLLTNDITKFISQENSTLIASGGFGEIFFGVHKERGKVALKRPRRLLDEALIRRFLREVDLWCSVSHQYILPCLGMCRIGPDVYVVSPFIENGDLLACIASGMDLNRSKLLYEVAEALAHLHHRGIVHGDVKAQNILLGDDGSALLCDFGLAKAFDTTVTSTESKGAGSLRWMAPELFQDESKSMASDVYSLGITIAEVLSGRMPFHTISDNVAVMFHVVFHDGRPPKEPSHSPEGKSYKTLWETAEKCWVKEVKARPYMAQVLGMLFPLTRETAGTSLMSL